MEFKDFPRFLGKSGKYEIHPPKFCAGIESTHLQRCAVSEVHHCSPLRGGVPADALRACVRALPPGHADGGAHHPL